MGPVVLALVVALPAQDVDVRWRGDPRCPEHGFQDSLARYLAGAAESRPVEVTVDVRRDGDSRWSATLVLATAEARSTRTLRGRSCAEIGDAAAFVTAVVVDPGVLSRPGGGAIVPAPEVPEAGGTDMSSGTSSGASGADAVDLSAEAAGAGPVGTDMSSETSVTNAAPVPAAEVETDMAAETGAGEPPVAPAPPVESVTPVKRPRGFVRVAGGLEALGMPRVGPQVGLAGGLLGKRWRVELTGFYRAPTTQYTDTDPRAGARVRMWAVGARGCGVPRAGPVEFPLCGGLEVGQVIGEGVGFVGARADRFAWVAAVFGPAIAWAPRPWLALWFGADVGLPLLRGTFSAAGLGPMYMIAPVSLRAALGLEFRFGR
ncbi:hypothetical protein [Nannocystis radixulma]|uniref:Uncharacterized protein n=1 Tax=Nannocystis radixulma TaxID=2995305 RepID=A0ABT5BRX8_9BACT|nr:hypothetical protein [Nannocystis radixulma]MDC0675742.1 hypothetical protein [Nannocystis radixulma]